MKSVLKLMILFSGSLPMMMEFILPLICRVELLQLKTYATCLSSVSSITRSCFCSKFSCNNKDSKI